MKVLCLPVVGCGDVMSMVSDGDGGGGGGGGALSAHSRIAVSTQLVWTDGGGCVSS